MRLTGCECGCIIQARPPVIECGLGVGSYDLAGEDHNGKKTHNGHADVVNLEWKGILHFLE